MNATVSRGLPTWLALLVLTCTVGSVCAGQPAAPTSRPVSAVLREPLPPEEIRLSESATGYLISGPTFTYRLEKATGAINGIRVVRERQEVVTSDGSADIQMDQYRLAGRNSCYRSADILVRLGLANAAEADKNVRAPFAFLHVLGNGELRPVGVRSQLPQGQHPQQG